MIYENDGGRKGEEYRTVKWRGETIVLSELTLHMSRKVTYPQCYQYFDSKMCECTVYSLWDTADLLATQCLMHGASSSLLCV